MSDNIPRQPAGSPQGGQFAATGHAEADVSLAPGGNGGGSDLPGPGDSVEYSGAELGLNDVGVTSLEIYRNEDGTLESSTRIDMNPGGHIALAQMNDLDADDDTVEYLEQHRLQIEGMYRERYGLLPVDGSEGFEMERLRTFPENATTQKIMTQMVSDVSDVANSEDPGSFGHPYFGSEMVEKLKEADRKADIAADKSAEYAAWTDGDMESEMGDEDAEPWTAEDLSDASKERLHNDAREFYDLAHEIIERRQISPEDWGGDFWLTRNGHGTGFWDRGFGQDGLKLSEYAQSFGSVDAVRGDDGKVELS